MLSVSASLSTAAEAHSRAKGSIGKQVQTMRMWQLLMSDCGDIAMCFQAKLR